MACPAKGREGQASKSQVRQVSICACDRRGANAVSRCPGVMRRGRAEVSERSGSQRTAARARRVDEAWLQSRNLQTASSPQRPQQILNPAAELQLSSAAQPRRYRRWLEPLSRLHRRRSLNPLGFGLSLSVPVLQRVAIARVVQAQQVDDLAQHHQRRREVLPRVRCADAHARARQQQRRGREAHNNNRQVAREALRAVADAHQRQAAGATRYLEAGHSPRAKRRGSSPGCTA